MVFIVVVIVALMVAVAVALLLADHGVARTLSCNLLRLVIERNSD